MQVAEASPVLTLGVEIAGQRFDPAKRSERDIVVRVCRQDVRARAWRCESADEDFSLGIPDFDQQAAGFISERDLVQGLAQINHNGGAFRRARISLSPIPQINHYQSLLIVCT
ncbi:hypothetical protein IP81_18670 [Novosphingobium sp. AAP83]|uniref:hypothetical protein n=1 Tax=Novosphingobium sp. AAP83 TaxID=1523425 RepID=UPI0006B93584|nr:hypothetical protein [Novosphingobium sp. AAP83]KPF87931.1 hypothetical protein IP81_18670 [Novosphingobium sp. AAP83]